MNVPTKWGHRVVHQPGQIKENAKTSKKVAQQAPPLLCLTSCHTHGTWIPSVLDRPGLRCARRPHIHTSALYCSFHCGHGKSQCGTEGEEMVAKSCGPCKALPCLASPCLHTQICTWTLTHTTWINRAIRGELSQLRCPESPQCLSILSNWRKSSTCRSHLVKYLRFCSHWDHFISEWTRCCSYLKMKGSPYGSHHGFLAYTYKLTPAQLLMRVTMTCFFFFFPSVWLSLWLHRSGCLIHTCTGGLVWYCCSLNTLYGLFSFWIIVSAPDMEGRI